MRDVFFLTCGTFIVPAAVVAQPGERARPRLATLSNTVAVVVRDSGDVVLVDAGWSREAVAAPARTLGRVQTLFLGMRVRQGDAIADQLERHGIAPSRVRAIVTTHLHADHVGGAADFPSAEIISTDVELTAFRTRGGRLDINKKGYRAEDLRGGRVRPVTLTGAPRYGFPASHDLYGDGEIVLVDCHGHTPGSVGVAIRSRERGTFVHVGDAEYSTWEHGLTPRGPSLLSRTLAWNVDKLKSRYQSMRDCEADPRRPVIVPSHDGRVFETLPHAPL